MRDLAGMIKDAKALPRGVPLRITKAENDRIFEEMSPLFRSPIPRSTALMLHSRSVQVVD